MTNKKVFTIKETEIILTNELFVEYIFEYLDNTAKTISKKEAVDIIIDMFLLNEYDALRIYEVWRYNFLNN
ncbi:hypothetical protein [Clostridium sardiniense]|uniref:hypothetical protein n=1 Tax=Clostridium sardiniense TaxID=29369 RepID=UPI001957C622|nr:hypothetical protein [Clostridium sardiniense]MBM7835572.1 hypothetical protein [Clostridium sardiniense]